MSATGKPDSGLDALCREAEIRGPWRSLDDLAPNDASAAAMGERLPVELSLPNPKVGRRGVLKGLGAAALALGGLSGCKPAEKILPYVRQPENVVPGVPRFYATALASEGYGVGAIVETHEGRPTKVEGNPDHPSSLGATDAVMQAACLALFDPDRARTPRFLGDPVGYDAFLADMAALRREMAKDGGARAAVLIEPTTSPTLIRQLAELQRAFPALRVYGHAPLAGDGVDAATTALFGRPLTPVYRVDRADVILSLDADFLAEGPGRLAHARAFAAGRRLRGRDDRANRLYAVESGMSVTGASADHRRAVPPEAIPTVAFAVLDALGGATASGPGADDAAWIRAVADDLVAAGPRALVVPDERAGADVAAAAFEMNGRLGALGRTVELVEPQRAAGTAGDLDDLAARILEGEISSVLSLADDPVRTTSSPDVAAAFARLDRLIHTSLHLNTTARLARWHIPAAHALESWSDIRGHDGAAAIVQPMIRPLHRGRTPHELLAALAGDFAAEPLGLVRATWSDLDDRAWAEALKRGVVAGSAPAPVEAPALRRSAPAAPPPAARLEIRFEPDPFLRDGRHANSAWLQELPRPLTKIVWGNAASLAPRTAARLGVETGDILRISAGGKTIEAPAWLQPGHAEECVTLPLGHASAIAGEAASSDGGFDAFSLKPRGAWRLAGAHVASTGDRRRILTTQSHQRMEGREPVRRATVDAFRSGWGVEEHGPDRSVYADWRYEQEAWGMSIDLTSCIGCMACVAACQSENNIPTVGPDECELGREMHWLRVDRYYDGPPDDPETWFQPVPCMHCEKAPCEVVCPVNATVHTHDGLNAQVYNRCIGTRYCSQNCPYKVRRFNFHGYRDFEGDGPDAFGPMRNPNVSVRERGVMEKCTYCVQRISAARKQARIDEGPIPDGAVRTACQQACPTQAISFGDLNDRRAHVVAEKAAPHAYALLAELNTRPRTTYLAALANPNPALGREEGEGDG